MKPILMFVQASCPYCKAARRWLDELLAEDARYRSIELTVVDENIERARANSFDYYYVPTFYVGDRKAHEGASSKAIIKGVLEEALGG